MDAKKLGIRLSKDPKYKSLLKQCYKYSWESNHPSTYTAALLIKDGKVILKGVNILPPGVKAKKDRFWGPNKHRYPNHAERDLVFKAAKKGIRTNGLIMVMPWLPCILCANAVISAGIKKLVIHQQMIERTKEKWVKELKDALQILREAGVDIVAYDGHVGAKAYMHDKKWEA